MSYGYLKGNPHTWKGGNGGGEAPPYSYGWPSGGTYEPDVVAQWLFDEASGNIVDEVAGIAMVPSNGPTYSVAATGVWAGVSPGITMTHASWQGFKAAGAVAALNLGTSDFVLEIVGTLDSDAYPKWAFSDIDGALVGWYAHVRYTGNTTAHVYIKADDATVAEGSFVYPVTPVGDGVIHKWRFAGNRSGTLELFFDKTSLGTIDISALVGSAVTSKIPCVGMRSNTDYPFGGTMYECRLTIGNCTNQSSGG